MLALRRRLVALDVVAGGRQPRLVALELGLGGFIALLVVELLAEQFHQQRAVGIGILERHQRLPLREGAAHSHDLLRHDAFDRRGDEVHGVVHHGALGRPREHGREHHGEDHPDDEGHHPVAGQPRHDSPQRPQAQRAATPRDEGVVELAAGRGRGEVGRRVGNVGLLSGPLVLHAILRTIVSARQKTGKSVPTAIAGAESRKSRAKAAPHAVLARAEAQRRRPQVVLMRVVPGCCYAPELALLPDRAGRPVI